MEPAILSKSSMYLLQPHCLTSLNVKAPIAFGSSNIHKGEALFTFISYEIYGHSCIKLNHFLCIKLLDIDCVKSVYAWRANSSVINTELRNGFWGVNTALEIREYLAGMFDSLYKVLVSTINSLYLILIVLHFSL